MTPETIIRIGASAEHQHRIGRKGFAAYMALFRKPKAVDFHQNGTQPKVRQIVPDQMVSPLNQ
jgi:hypothetical protein